MRKSFYPVILFVGLLGALLGACPAWSLEFDVSPAFVDRRSTFLRFVFCYDVRTLALLNCRMSYKILGLESPAQVPCEPLVGTCIEETLVNTGGHNHDDSHPLIDNRQDAGVQLLKNGVVFTGTLEREITFQTDDDAIVVLHNVPQVSGRIAIQTSTLQFPPRYQCASRGVCDFRDTVNVQVDGLVELTATDTDTFVLTGETARHPSNHFGSANANDKLKKAAAIYLEKAKKKLSINDMSLPKGGMLDLCGTYNPATICSEAPKGGHDTHRTGTDADIDQLGVPCLNDKDFRRAVIEAGARFKCESGGRKHVDLD